MPVAPEVQYIIDRYQNEDAVQQASMAANYARIAPIALKLVSDLTEIAIPSNTFTGERITLSGKTDFALQNWFPILSISRAVLSGNRPLKIAASEEDLFSGKADVAIGEDGEQINLAPWLSALRGVPMFVDYKAGYDIVDDKNPPNLILPADLLELYAEQARLIAKETQRSGISIQKAGEGQTTFTKLLPDWCVKIINSRRRMQLYV